MDSADSATPAVCPPAEPYGVEVGGSAEDVLFTDCSGVQTSLHGLCGQPALIVNWYGWCPSCGDNAALARSLAEAHPELAVVQVLDEDPLGAPVNGEFCSTYAEAYPSAAAVWMDPDQGLERYGGTDEVLVLDRNGGLQFARQTANAEVITAAVEAVLDGT